MQRGRRIAFDYGDVRIGVAVCDPDAILSSPLTTLQTKSKDLFDQIVEILEEHEPITIFIGKPTLLSGLSGEAVQKVEDFRARLSEFTDIEIVLIDERLSTVSALKDLQSAGVNAKDARKSVDSLAAVAILQQGLAMTKSRDQ
jgi:putative Holliday junction resolvase